MFMAQKDATVSVGIIVVFVQLMRNISQLGITMPELIAKMKSAKRLMEKNDRLLQINKETGKRCSLTCKQSIRLNQLSYYYNDSSAGLDQITCTIPANGCYAVIGDSGSGKSTFLNLLAGVNKEYTGEIQYDDVEIRDIASECITDLVSVVYQDVFIFDASIKDNLTLFGLFDEQKLDQAIQKSGLQDIVNSKGLDYLCGDGGNALSGGERQRIGIARSIMQGTDVLLMDEATSALDTQTGFQIIETVQKMTGKTRIIITHDLYPTLMQKFDAIFVFRNGKLVEQGKYEKLMAKKGICYELINKN
jgi:ABC-type bacteriocin/lantibiotic exporter with double-glycine peptidase domain